MGLALMLAALLVAACDDDDAAVSSAPATETAVAATPAGDETPMAATPAGDETPAAGGDPSPTTDAGVGRPNESGAEPIFWRTVDDFASLRAGEPYKIIFRVTNGYEGDTLPVAAVADDGTEIDFEATRVEPGEGEAPGVYYALNVDLPLEGPWVLIAVAGDDTSTMEADAQAGG